MGKLLNAVLLVAAINLAMVMFLGASIPGSSLWTLITNPSAWSNLSLIDYIQDTLGLVGLAGIVIGSFFIKSDFLVFAGISTIFLSFGMGLVEFHQRVSSTFDAFSPYITTLMITPLILAYIYVIFKFWRGND